MLGFFVLEQTRQGPAWLTSAGNKICYSLIHAQHFAVQLFSVSYGLSRFSPACMLLSQKMAGFD
jgi:hypothetical protein